MTKSELKEIVTWFSIIFVFVVICAIIIFSFTWLSELLP